MGLGGHLLHPKVPLISEGPAHQITIATTSVSLHNAVKLPQSPVEENIFVQTKPEYVHHFA